MVNRTLLLLCATVFVFSVLSASAQSDSKTLFVRNCSLCHGNDGRAQTSMGKALKAADLTTSAVQSKSDAELYKQIANGKGKMAGYENILGKKGVEDMVKYVRTLAPKKQ
ncbi:MAG TPA: cytochrome c [Terriglobales bacterium]|nr:cytochrome c [Terriglobales bacterium]